MPRSTGVPLPPFQSLYDEHRDVVQRFVVSLVGAQDAGDVVQETWLAALRAYPSLPHADNLRGWLLTIAQRKALDEHRARGGRPEPRCDRPAADGAAAAAPDGDDALWAAVRRLPPKQRAAVAHRFVADLPYRDIAALMGTSPEAARRSVHDALRRLRTTWTP